MRTIVSERIAKNVNCHDCGIEMRPDSARVHVFGSAGNQTALTPTRLILCAECDGKRNELKKATVANG